MYGPCLCNYCWVLASAGTGCPLLGTAHVQSKPSCSQQDSPVHTQVADMLEAAVARSNPDEDSRQQADKSGLLARGLHFSKDPVSAAKKVHASFAIIVLMPTGMVTAGRAPMTVSVCLG